MEQPGLALVLVLVLQPEEEEEALQCLELQYLVLWCLVSLWYLSLVLS